MRAGTLRHLCMVQSLQVTRDTAGAEVQTWQDIAAVSVAIEPLAGREFFAAQQVNAELSHRVRMRYRPGLIPTMRLQYGTRALLIESIINLQEHNRELELLCREVIL
ncbi:MAG: head-tail adaptor protein [Nitrospira sp.]|nr:MAG: head-tail adaptor protein [Nitrospira sp.]